MYVKSCGNCNAMGKVMKNSNAQLYCKQPIEDTMLDNITFNIILISLTYLKIKYLFPIFGHHYSFSKRSDRKKILLMISFDHLSQSFQDKNREMIGHLRIATKVFAYIGHSTNITYSV